MSNNVLVKAAEAIQRIDGVWKSGDEFVRKADEAIRLMREEVAQAVAKSEQTQKQLHCQLEDIRVLQTRVAAAEEALAKANSALSAAATSLASEGEAIGARVDDAKKSIRNTVAQSHQQLLPLIQRAVLWSTVASAIASAGVLLALVLLMRK
jgi:phage shock protein A